MKKKKTLILELDFVKNYHRKFEQNNTKFYIFQLLLCFLSIYFRRIFLPTRDQAIEYLLLFLKSNYYS